MKGMIAAISPEGAIGLDGAIPWNHPGDMKRFVRVTRGTTVIMGRLTWESMKGIPLVKRRNMVITSKALPGVEHYPDIRTALTHVHEGDVWFIGGARIYEDAMSYVDVIDLTFVPDSVTDPRAVKFPEIDPRVFSAGPIVAHEDEAGLTRRIFTRRRSA